MKQSNTKQNLKILFFLQLMLLIVINVQSQITSPTYYITENSDTIHGEIINNRWKNTPQNIQFRTSVNDEFKVLGVGDFTLLVIDNYRRIRSEEVYIGNAKSMSIGLDLPLEKKEILIEDVIIGNLNLYVNRNGVKQDFFYSEGNDSIYRLERAYNGNVAESISAKERNIFRYQLWDFKRCNTIGAEEIDELVYTMRSLSKYFERLNSCLGYTFKNYELVRKKAEKKTEIRFNLRGGLNYSSFKLKHTAIKERNTQFNNEVSLRFGGEIEFLLPYNNYHFAVIIEPNYNSYSEEEEVYLTLGQTMTTTADFQYLEIPFGVRYYLFGANLEKKVKHNFFINGLTLVGFNLGGEIASERKEILDGTYNINVTFGGGLGYLYSNKLSFEVRSSFSSDLLTDYLKWKGLYRKHSVVLGYRL